MHKRKDFKAAVPEAGKHKVIRPSRHRPARPSCTIRIAHGKPGADEVVVLAKVEPVCRYPRSQHDVRQRAERATEADARTALFRERDRRLRWAVRARRIANSNRATARYMAASRQWQWDYGSDYWVKA